MKPVVPHAYTYCIYIYIRYIKRVPYCDIITKSDMTDLPKEATRRVECNMIDRVLGYFKLPIRLFTSTAYYIFICI